MSYLALWERMKLIQSASNNSLFASNQYGMLMILGPEGEIILNLTPLLLDEDERKKARSAA